jgi:hypothetical protein
VKRLARRAVRSAVSGVLPWIPIALVTDPAHLSWALTVSLVLSLLTLGVTIWVADPIKNLEILDAGYFAIVIAAYLFATSAFVADMSRWIAEASTAVILIYAVGSLLLRRPFTSQYTLLALPDGGGRTADFIRTNQLMSAMWVVVFGVQLACLVIAKSVLARPDDLLFGWLVPIGSLVAGFILNAGMTRALVERQNVGTASELESRS